MLKARRLAGRPLNAVASREEAVVEIVSVLTAARLEAYLSRCNGGTSVRRIEDRPYTQDVVFVVEFSDGTEHRVWLIPADHDPLYGRPGSADWLYPLPPRYKHGYAPDFPDGRPGEPFTDIATSRLQPAPDRSFDTYAVCLFWGTGDWTFFSRPQEAGWPSEEMYQRATPVRGGKVVKGQFDSDGWSREPLWS